jgi:hypothetical protein
MYETKGHTLEAIEERYSENQAQRSTGRWRLGGDAFKMRRIRGTQL